MTAIEEAWKDGRLADAIALRRELVEQTPDARGKLHLFELLAVADRFREAVDLLESIESEETDWPQVKKRFRSILKAELDRKRHRLPRFASEAIPLHAKQRVRGIRALRMHEEGEAQERFDRAEASSPLVTGYVDGREFEGLRDADDRYASILETFLDGKLVWFPFEQLRGLVIHPPRGPLDERFCPARVTTMDGLELELVLPLTYPAPRGTDEELLLGRDTDWLETETGWNRGVGAKLFLIGEDELPLKECRRFEFGKSRAINLLGGI